MDKDVSKYPFLGISPLSKISSPSSSGDEILAEKDLPRPLRVEKFEPRGRGALFCS